MSKNIFNELQIQQLENNPNVLHVSEKSISYHPDFKLKAVKEWEAGKLPTQIFIENGFVLSVIGADKPAKCLNRWRKTYKQFGEEGFKTERRGKGSGGGRPSTKNLSTEELLKRAEAKIKFLEAENDFLKKLDELERQALKKKR